MNLIRATAAHIVTAAAALTVMAGAASGAMAQAPVRAAFTDSSADGLGATRRVAIASVVVSFQAAVAGEKAAGSGMLADKTSAKSVLALPVMDPMMQEAIATEAYRQLKADLTAAGFEVVPEDQVKANVSYKEILKGSGTPNHTRFGNALGDAMLVSPPSLLPYMPYAMEGSRFEQPTSHIGWVSAMGGKSITPGGPSMTSIQSNWKQPGLEVQMAKDLNAHVVKAFYVVTIGTASATRSRELTPGSTITRTGNGSALAEVGLLADQTRIAFRSPNGNAKWQKVAVTKPAPAKDGDVVIRLADPMSGRSDLFSVTSSGSQGGLLRPGADFQFSFVATLTDNAGYQKDVQGMIAAADQSMVALVKR